MNESAGNDLLKSLPGLTLDQFEKTCDLTSEEAGEIYKEIDKIRAKMDEAANTSKRAASDEALREHSILELQDALDGINVLLEKYGAHRPGMAPLVILKSLASIALISLRMA